MPAKISLAGIKLTIPQRQDLESGVLSDDVYVQFVCQTGPGEHDPESPPDEHVRPSHAAFHGKVFKLADAPVPPLDYGCRCAIRYVAAPGTVAEALIGETAPSDPTTPAEATAEWLKENVEDLESLKRSAAAAKTRDSLSVATLRAKKLGVPNPRTIAEMVVDILNGGL